MKNFALVLALMVSVTAFSQVSLKGYTFGKKLNGEDFVEATVGGIDGYLNIYTLKDNRIFAIRFIPMYEDLFDYKMQAVSQYYFDLFKEGAESRYGVKLEKSDSDIEKTERFDFDLDFRLDGKNGDIKVRFLVQELSKEANENILFWFDLFSDELVDEFEKERKSDF